MGDKMKAADDARRIINGLRGLLTLADETAELGSIEQAVAETKTRLDGLREDERAARELIAGAQTHADGLVADAQRKADDVVATARETGAAELKAEREAAALALEKRRKELLAEPEKVAAEAREQAETIIAAARAEAERLVSAAKADPAYRELDATKAELAGLQNGIAAARCDHAEWGTKVAEVQAEHERITGLIEGTVAALESTGRRARDARRQSGTAPT
jgi:cell division septum initiation protein DivIVA